MKYIMVIGDGMADTKLVQLENKTPLEALDLPMFNQVAGCFSGRVKTIPDGMPAGSDTAILSIFGNDPRIYYTGRSVLEAAGMDIPLAQGDVSFRVNFCAVSKEEDGKCIIHSHNGGNIHGQQAIDLMETLLTNTKFIECLNSIGMKIFPTDTFRHIGLISQAKVDLSAMVFTEPHNILDKEISPYLPHLCKETTDEETLKCLNGIQNLMDLSYEILSEHPINLERIKNGQLPANMIWPWGAATIVELPSFEKKYNKKGTVISAVPLVWGIASLGGLKTPKVEGANGDVDTNYEGKVETALQALNKGDDFVTIHIEAPDEMSHAGELEKKLEAMTYIENRVLVPIFNAMREAKEEFRLLLLSDHPTLLTTRSHSEVPVPYAIYDSRVAEEIFEKTGKYPTKKFSESSFANDELLTEGTELMAKFFEMDNPCK